MIKHDSKKKKLFLGIEILRMLLCLLIVIVHCYNQSFAYSKLFKFPFKALPFYVPTFFLISFYFSYKTLISKDIKRIYLRFIRILIPYIVWPSLIWIMNIFINCSILKLE